MSSFPLSHFFSAWGIYHLPPVTCHLSPVTCHLSPATCHLLSVKSAGCAGGKFLQKYMPEHACLEYFHDCWSYVEVRPWLAASLRKGIMLQLCGSARRKRGCAMKHSLVGTLLNRIDHCYLCYLTVSYSLCYFCTCKCMFLRINFSFQLGKDKTFKNDRGIVWCSGFVQKEQKIFEEKNCNFSLSLPISNSFQNSPSLHCEMKFSEM